MKRFLLISAMAAGLLAAPSLATAATGTVNISGTITPTCNITSTNPVNVAVGTDTFVTAGGKLNDAALNTAIGTPSFTGWCNGAGSTIAITATDFTTGATAPSGFSNTVALTVSADAGAVSVDDGDPAEALGPFNGNVTINVAPVANATDILIAGAYSATITLTLTGAN